MSGAVPCVINRMNSFFRLLLLCIGCLLLGADANLNAQQTRGEPSRNPAANPIGSSLIPDTIDSGILPLDTPVAMTYVLIGNPDIQYSLQDTFSWKDNRHYPTDLHQSHLGNYGSAVRSLAPSINFNNGFHTGWMQYDPFYVHPDSFQFYDQLVPVMKAKYSQASQKDTYLSVIFGRSFARGFSLSLTYDRLNQLGEFGHQQQINTAVGLGIWHNAPSGRYDAFYQFTSNAAVAEENGGLALPEKIGNDSFPNPLVPIFIQEGNTTHKHRYVTTKQILHLISDTADFGIDLWVKGHLSSSLYKYTDATNALNVDYYTPLFITDDRGLRQYTYHNEYQLSGGLSLPWKAARSTLQASLRYRSINLEQEPITERINEVYFDASGYFRWIDPLELTGSASIGLGQSDGLFAFQAKGILHTGFVGQLEGSWSLVTRRPYMVENRLFINQQLIYDTDFADPLTTKFGVAWRWPDQKLHAGIEWLLYDNYIYFNAERLPVQINEAISIRRFFASKDFDFKWIGLTADLIWQPDISDELALPGLIYTAGIYGRLKLFRKKLTVMPGIDLTYHDEYAGITYFPASGVYALISGPSVKDYYRIDAALGAHINFLKIFVRMEDVVGLWDNRVLYQANYYPHFPGYFRIGVETSFFN